MLQSDVSFSFKDDRRRYLFAMTDGRPICLSPSEMADICIKTIKQSVTGDTGYYGGFTADERKILFDCCERFGNRYRVGKCNLKKATKKDKAAKQLAKAKRQVEVLVSLNEDYAKLGVGSKVASRLQAEVEVSHQQVSNHTPLIYYRDTLYLLM